MACPRAANDTSLPESQARGFITSNTSPCGHSNHSQTSRQSILTNRFCRKASRQLQRRNNYLKTHHRQISNLGGSKRICHKAKSDLRFRRPRGLIQREIFYFGFAEPFPGNGMCSLTVVFGRCLAVPVLTNSPVFALRSPILLCGFLLINNLPFLMPVAWAESGALALCHHHRRNPR